MRFLNAHRAFLRLEVMMLLTSFIAAVAFGNPQDDGALFQKLFPSPSGKNGYEEYVMAVDYADRNLWNTYDQWLAYLSRKEQEKKMQSDDDVPPVPPGVSPEMTDLDVRKIMDEKFSNAIHWISEGNRKGVTSPRREISVDTTFPEYAGFRLLARVDANKAHVEFADGRTSSAVKDLLEGLKFSQNFFGTSRLSSLVSIGSQTIVFSEFENHLSQLSNGDAMDIDRSCKAMLSQPLALKDLLRMEYQAWINDLDTIFEKPEILFVDDKDKSFVNQIAHISPSERENIKPLIVSGLDARMGEEMRRFDGPETGWMLRDQSPDPVASKSDLSISNLALIVVNALQGKAIKTQYANAVAKGRIQLRLLRLHAQVIEYKWQHNKLPTKLEDFAKDHAGFDPIANEPFHYELKDGSYRIYSMGIPGLGRMELRYRNTVPPKPSPDTPLPPTQ